MLTPDVFVRALFVTEAQDDVIVKRILQSSAGYEKSVLDHISNQDHFWLKTEEGLVMWKSRVCIPRYNALREDIIRLHHDPPVIGHPGANRTLELIMRNYWWP